MTTSMSSPDRSTNRAAEAEPGYTIGTFPKAVAGAVPEAVPRQKYPAARAQRRRHAPGRAEKFSPPPGYDAHREHHRVFYEAVRSRKRPVEDAVFGFRAAGPALLANVSYFEKRICKWDRATLTAS